jgi:hypothetical protein
VRMRLVQEWSWSQIHISVGEIHMFFSGRIPIFVGEIHLLVGQIKSIQIPFFRYFSWLPSGYLT